ncbi:circularly permuted type 2 ATP-grasp protein [Nocardioides dongxiaopingii]|uniref:circularly permuted type 2 ATP-grasp protein n=1 Tax=Nocardioides dongxiaopingii TaxID=2576036 RepID=UPI0010C76685|nr:circularly permuted type 2 ATP-grasp protein [Nocardioides dongxiaopingii]
MNAMFEGYGGNGQAYDEMFDGDELRSPYLRLRESLATLTTPELVSRVEALQAGYLAQGVTFDIGGEERAFPLDILPRVIEQDTWSQIDAGVQQRVRALEMFLADVYDAGTVFDDGVIPRRVITTSSHYHRASAGVRPPNGVRVHVSGIDLIRDNAGEFRVLEDNVRVPSGVSYVMTNRRAISSALPETIAQHRIRPVAAYPQRLLAALRAAAPAGVTDPNVVVLTPGVYNGAYFEHALLARTMGVELVEGRDLECRRGRVMMRTTQGLAPVHVIYRRIDDEFLDPVHFRADSTLGCPGMVDAARAGNVTLANAVGNGVADDKLVYTYLPDIIRYYLSEEPVLKNVDTWRVGNAEAREEVLDRLDELVLKPVDGSGGKGIVIGPRASRAELDELRTKILAAPRDWIAQPVVQLSTVPTFVDGELGPRHVDLRPFAVNDGNRVWVLPGGLTRVALARGELIVNSSRGGGSKDTWVLAGPRVAVADLADEAGEGDAVAEVPEVREATEPPSPPPPPATQPETPGPALTALQEQAEQQQQAGPTTRSPRC